VLPDICYSSYSGETERKNHDFIECVWDHKAKLKLNSAGREALHDVVSTTIVAKVILSVCLV